MPESAQTVPLDTPSSTVSDGVFSIASLFVTAQSDMNRVEQRMMKLFRSDAPALTEISEYLLQLGGKRIRPLLALLTARLVGMPTANDNLIDIAAGIELIHMATLLHDDIIDESPTRRRQPSAFARFGVPPTLLTGDFLLVRAFGLCAHLGEFIVEATERACVELTEGEILEGKLDPQAPLSFDQYINIIGKKTGSLFALATETGSHIAGAKPTVVATLREFGFLAGVAFQIVDDILDIVADEDLLGKPVGTDLRQKTPSLVNVIWLTSGDSRAREFFEQENPSREECKATASYLATSPVIDRCRQIAVQYAQQAQQKLNEISPAVRSLQTKEQLHILIDYTMNRCL